MTLIHKLKTQISIFILISILIIFLFFYLISTNNNSIKKNLEISKTNSNTQENLVLIPIKEKIDICLNNALRKATIISGYRGGFIYDHSSLENHEYYTKGIILSNDLEYNQNLLRNYDLNLNYLSSNVLVYSQSEVYVPRLDSNFILGSNIIYPKSIKSDFENYMMFDFLKCLNLEDYENKGFKVNYDHYIGKIENFDLTNNLIWIKNLEGNDGDKVKISIGNKIYIGEIKGDLNNDLRKVDFSLDPISSISTNEDIYNSYGINLKTKSKLNITFSNDKINANLYFPITIDSLNSSFKFSSSNVNLNNRFKQLLLLSNILISNKYINKSLDLNNPSILNQIIRNSPVLRNINFNIKFFKTPINNSNEKKVFVYSIIDNQSRIMGSPFIFNFGYENIAPNFNLSRFGSNLGDNSFMMIVSKNQEFNIDLKSLTTDPQSLDNFKSFYHPYEYNGVDGRFKITSAGQITFEGYLSKIYSFDVTVDDHEATRTKKIYFVTGFPDNTNNVEAKNCFKFVNNYYKVFPILNTYRNKLFHYLSSSNYNELFGYTQYLDPTKNYPSDLILPPSKLEFLKTCAYDSKLFSVSYSIKELGGNEISNGVLNEGNNFKIDVPKSDKILNISVFVKDSSGHLMTEPFNVKIYPVSCLGPKHYSDTSILSHFGGSLSCCDLSNLRNLTNPENPISLVGANSNLISDGSLELNADMYFCYTPSKDSNFGNFDLFNFEKFDIWDKIGNDATDLFEGNLKATCKGKYPIVYLNLDDLNSGSSNLGNTSKIRIESNNYIDYNMNVKLKRVKSGGVCNFCYINNKTNHFRLLFNRGSKINPIYWELQAGFKVDNTGNIDGYGIPDAGVSPLIPSTDEASLFILTNNNWFNKEGSSSWEISNSGNFYGVGSNLDTISIGKEYCAENTEIPKVRVNSPTYDSKIDYSCTDYYVDGSTPFNIKSKAAPTTRVCGSYTHYVITEPCHCDGSNKIFSYDTENINLYCNPGGTCESHSNEAVPTCDITCS